VALAIVLVLGVVHNLERPFVKERIQRLVRSKAGVDIDYRATRFGLLSGIEIEDLVVRSPLALRGVAPDLARIGRFEAAWTSALFTGPGWKIDGVTLSDVALTVAIDADGKTSFDGLGPASAAPAPSTPTPLSHRASDLVASAPALPKADVTGLSLTLVRSVRTEHGDVLERSSLEGLELHVQAEAAAGEWHLRANVGSPTAPLELAVARAVDGASAGDAHARMWLTADATGRDVVTALDLEVTKQTIARQVDVKRVLHAEARAHFDPVAQTTSVSIDHTFAADGIATLEASIDLPDHGAPLVRHSQGEVDFVRLLGLVPPDLAPVRASLRRGHVQYRIDDLALDALPRLSDGSKVELDADFADVKVTPVGDGAAAAEVDVANATVAIHVEPAADASIRAHASVAIEGGRLGAGRDAALVDGLTCRLDATQARGGALSGAVALAFATIKTTGALHLAAKDGKVELRVGDLVPDRAAPLATRGDVTLTTELASLEARSQTTRTLLDRLAFTAHSRLAGGAPWALDADVRAALLRVFDGGGHALGQAPVHVAAKVVDVAPDWQLPIASTGAGRAVVDAGDVHLEVDATKARDALDFTLDSKAGTLEAVRRFLPQDLLPKLPVERMAVALRSHGRIEGLRSAALSIREHTELRVDHPSYDRMTARAAALVVDSNGTTLHHELHGDLRFEGLTLAGTSPSDDRIAFNATLERQAQAPAVALDIDASGRARAKLRAAFAFDRARRAVSYDLEASVARLSPLAPLASMLEGLAQVDLSQLEVALSARGALLGVVSEIDRDGEVHLEAAPWRTAKLDGTIAVHAKHVGWSGGDASLSAPAIALDATLHADADRRTIEGHLAADALRFANGRHTFDVAGLSDQISATMDGDLAAPSLESKQTMTVRLVKQDVQPAYPVGDATLALALRRSRDGLVHISNLAVANGAGGTSFTLAGTIDPSDYQRRLSLHGELHQDLARMSSAPERLAARGTASVALRVESPDLTTFRTVADVRVEGADLRLPGYGVIVEGADGEVPITVSLRAGPHGIRMIREDQDNPYSSLRFADQHPLLSRSSFISIRRLTLPQVTISPLAGNLQIEQNIVSLRQFEIGIRGGRVTGQCALDWNGQKSTLDMHVRADGVQSSHGEPFTGSAALVVSAAEHSIEGRADILQIGKRHLLDLLDLEDPFHADAAINKIRSSMSYGYPDKLRVTFNHGFASVHVAFGGLAGLISVGDLRGLPIGPLIDRLIPLYLPSKDEP
jgi:translocation and assembly module TamB